jgi:hypothetical protein
MQNGDGACSAIDTACTMHAVSLTPHAKYDTACTIFACENRSYLGEFESEFKKALARESGAQGVLFDEKTEGRKSRDNVPLRFKREKDKMNSKIYRQFSKRSVKKVRFLQNVA